MKFIKTFDQFLKESYENINDLNNLTIDMLKILANHIAKNCNILSDDIYLNNPLKLLTNKYTPDIQKFVDSRYLKYIDFVTISKEPDIKGLYDQNSQGIKLVTKLDKDSIGILMSKNEKEIDFYLYKFYPTLLHELQHAFDDFRSDGKFHNQKEYTSNLNNLDKYTNVKAELDAYFTATVVRLFYYDEKYIDTPTSDEDYIVIVERIIKDFNNIKNQFIDKYPNWHRLNQENKKDLIYQLGKYYIRKKEEIILYNKEKHTKDFNL